MIYLKLLLPIVLAVPEVVVNWQNQQYEALDIFVSGEDELLEKCLKSGLQHEYKFQVKLCKRRFFWFDGCPDSRTEKHTLSYDAISQTYKLVSDRHGDEIGPETKYIDSKEEAILRLRSVRAMPLLFLAHGDEGHSKSRRAYVSVKVGAFCRGENSKTLERISYFLTLGLVRLNGFKTDWIDYSLKRE